MTPALTRIDLEEVLDQRLANHPTRADLAKMRAEIAADTRAANAVLLEDAFKGVRVIDDQYKDLPDRVKRLEDAVFPPPPPARRKRSG